MVGRPKPQVSAAAGDQIGRPYTVLENGVGIYWRGWYGFLATEVAWVAPTLAAGRSCFLRQWSLRE